MLSDRVKELICRAVDGDLSDRQRRALQKLLLESEEARGLFHRLRLDAQRLKNLPRKELPAHFSTEVVRSLGHEPTIRPSSVSEATQKYLPMWANLVAALAVLVAVSAGTYIVVTLDQQQKAARESAERKPPAPAPDLSPKHSAPGPEVAHQNHKDETPGVETLPRPREEEVASAPLPELPEAQEPDNKAALTVPFNRTLDLFKVEMPKLPPIMAVRELDKALKAELRKSLTGEDAVHLDLFCKDANKGVERVLQALRGQGRRVLVEALAHQRLQAKVKTNYVIFAETLTPADVEKLLEALAVEERKNESPQLEKLVAVPMSAVDQKTLAALLGIDLKLLNLKSKPAERLDPQKPLSDSTADKLAKALEKQPGTKPSDGMMLALSYNPVRPKPELSKEVREFLAARKDRRPGTIAVMLVIRNID